MPVQNLAIRRAVSSIKILRGWRFRESDLRWINSLARLPQNNSDSIGAPLGTVQALLGHSSKGILVGRSRRFSNRSGGLLPVCPQPPKVVWNLSLQTGSEGPTLIS